MNPKTTRSWSEHLRHLFWPVYGRHEHRLVIPLFLVSFLIGFVYNILRPIKTTLVVSVLSDAKILPYLKLWAVLPGAFLSTYFYTKLADKYRRSVVFFATLGVFFVFFLAFLIFLYPHRETLVWHSSRALEQFLPAGLEGAVGMFRYWHFSLFYTFSELWASVAFSLVFWGYVNEMVSMGEAKRFYGLFIFSGNISCIVAGFLGASLGRQDWRLPFLGARTEMERSVEGVLLLALAAIAVIWLLLRCTFDLNRQTAKAPSTGTSVSVEDGASVIRSSGKRKKENLSFRACWQEVKKSPYLMGIAGIMLSYNLMYNLSEVMWTEMSQLYYSNHLDDFRDYQSRMVLWTGVVSILFSFFLCGNLISKFGWLVAALVAPFIWLVFGGSFFTMILFLTADNVWVLIMGSLMMGLGRASKYTLFDETKEMAFVPLPVHSQRRGKAIVDGLGGWVGRAGGALIYQILLLFFVELSSMKGWILGCFFIIMAIWSWSVFRVEKGMQPFSGDDLGKDSKQIGPALTH